MTDLDTEAIAYYVDEVLDIRQRGINTHYSDCWKHHVGCLAVVIKAVLNNGSPK